MSISPQQPHVDPDTECTHPPSSLTPRLWNRKSITDLINLTLSKVSSEPAYYDRELTYDDLKSVCGKAIRQGFIEIAGIDPDRSHATRGGARVPYNPNCFPSQEPAQQAQDIETSP